MTMFGRFITYIRANKKPLVTILIGGILAAFGLEIPFGN